MSADAWVGNQTAVTGHERAVDPDDSVLWSRARAGDTDAFGSLFERLFWSPKYYDIYVMNPDGSGQRNLTRDPRWESSDGAWSPDGRKIAYARSDASSRPETRPEIVVRNADGSGKRTLADGADPVWSPDGRRIAFTKGRADALDDGESSPARLEEIYVMNADGSEQRRLTRNELPDGGPEWSPDGQKILFSRGGY